MYVKMESDSIVLIKEICAKVMTEEKAVRISLDKRDGSNRLSIFELRDEVPIS